MWQLDGVRVKSIFSGTDFLKFGLDASGTLVKHVAQCIIIKFRNPITMFVGLDSDRQ